MLQEMKAPSIKSMFGCSGRTPRPVPCAAADRLPPIRIETERLVLRPPTPADFTPLREMARDTAMFLYSERGPMRPDEAWSLLLRHIGCWTALGYGLFSVLDKCSGRMVGQVGASDFRRGLGEDFDGHPEISWSIAAGWRGRGLATEACRASLDWLDREIGAARSVCLINGGNAASIRVAEKAGFAPWRSCAYRGYVAALFARERGA